MKNKICFGSYSFDIGPEQMFNVISQVIVSRGHSYNKVTGSLKDGDIDTVVKSLEECDVVFLGMQAYKDDEELYIAQALKDRDSKIWAVSDVPLAERRPTRRFVKSVDGVLVARADDVSSALEIGYKEALFFGPPAHWKDAFSSISEIRNSPPVLKKRLGGGEIIDLDPNDKIILIVGTKDNQATNEMLERVTSAIHGIDNLVVAITFHPRAFPLITENQSQIRKDLISSNQTIVTDDIKTDQLMAIAHLTVVYGGHTGTYPAAVANLPMIMWYDDRNKQEFKTLGCKNGRWPAEELGGMLPVQDQRELRDLIFDFCNHGTSTGLLKKKQEKSFPIPSDWNTAENIVSFFEGK